MTQHVLELLRYGINGVIATAVHYSVLTFNLEVLDFGSAGLANFIAALFGITSSFIGNKYLVFRKSGENKSIIEQAMKFCGLYGVIAIFHGLIMALWADIFHLDYRYGFLLATAIQFSLSYLGNKFLVFRS